MIQPLLNKTQRGLVDKGRSDQFIILVFFGLTFVLARLVVNLQVLGVLPPNLTDPHVHHLVPGIILVILGGYLGLTFFSSQKTRWIASTIFGIGAGLTLDEFALWLNLKDVYWLEEGRRSIDAVIITAILFVVIFFLSEAHDHRWFPFKKYLS